MKPSIDLGWIDRCLGEPSPVAFDPDQLVAAKAAARAALEGATDVPRVEVSSYAPDRQAQVACTVAAAALAAKRDASILVDAAFAEATKVSDAAKRERVLGWGVIELRRAGDPARATKWAAAIADADYKPELVAHEVARLAAAGDGDGARKALGTLPASWGLFSDVEFWPGYPRWIGSAGAAACVALASPAFAKTPAARALVEDAEKLTAKVSEEWRQNREYAAIALAWARVGDLDRALVATSHMPGSERSTAIASVLDGFGDAPGVELAHVGALARKAIAASRSAPAVIGAKPADDTGSFVESAVTADVTAALVRRHIARRDLAAAKAAAESIPENLSRRYEAELQVACAGSTNVDAIVAGLADTYRANLAAAAAQVKCFDVTARLLKTLPHGENFANNLLWSTIAANRLDDASALLAKVGSRLRSIDLAENTGALAYALARDGRGAEALALIKATAVLEYKNTERALVSAGYRSVAALVANGDLANAKALDALLAPRLANADAMPN